MFPNRLYYFSIRAIKVDAAREPVTPPSHSVWVSIPVTTSLLEAPARWKPCLSLRSVSSDRPGSRGLRRGLHNTYKRAGRRIVQGTVKGTVDDSEGPDGKTYYGRVTGLETRDVV